MPRTAARRGEARRRWDRRLLRLPLVGDLITKAEVARLARTLGTLLKNGVSPLAALAVTRETLRNTVIADAVGTVADSLKQGKGLAEPLSRSKVVPVLAIQLIRVGEETAKLDEMLVKTAEIYDAEVARSVAASTLANFTSRWFGSFGKSRSAMPTTLP